jgi:hypothetical protein
MVSEDSDQFVFGLLPVHRLNDLGDLDQAVGAQVSTTLDQLHALRELLEVASFRRPKRELVKERYDRLHQIVATIDDVLAQVLCVVVVPLVDEDSPDTEELFQFLEHRDAPYTLRHHEPMCHLIAGSVASSPRTASLPYEANREASFSVYKTDHPTTELDQPFLLIFRTRHVVTLDITSDAIE